MVHRKGPSLSNINPALRVLIVAAVVAWWLPSLLLAMTRLWGGRLRFEVAIGLGRVLVAVGLPAIASRLYGAEIARAERKMRAVGGRRR